MKPALLASLSFLLFVFASSPLPCRATAANEPVLDVKGDKVRAGADYYILPVIRGRGGGLTLAGRNKTSSCPLGVVQDRYEVSNGLPLTFSPANARKGVVRVSTDMNIKFSAATVCVQSTVWKLDAYDEETKQWFVTTAGVEGNPGRTTTGNWFKIEKYDQKDYNLRFCPSVCNYCKVICRDIGIYIEGGIRRLALSDEPFRVMFKKA